MDREHRSFDEPSVLDYVKSKLSFGRAAPVQIPESSVIEAPVETQPPTAESRSAAAVFPWVSFTALGLALIAQYSFEPPDRSAVMGLTFYAIALGLLLWAILRREWVLAQLAESSAGRDPLTFRRAGF